MTSLSPYWIVMTRLWICFIIQCRIGILPCRCLFRESILPNNAAHNQTLIWSTTCGKFFLDSVTKICNGQMFFKYYRCFLNIIGLREMGGEIRDIMPLVSRITVRCYFPFMRVVYRAIASVTFVLSSLRPWPILHATSF